LSICHLKDRPLPPTPLIDFEWLRATLYHGARAAFTHIVECNGSESFYAFSLYSISDHTGIYAAANSIEGFRRRLRQYRESGLYSDRAIASFAKDVRWSVGDWKYFGVEAPGQKEFDSIYRVLNRPENTDDNGRWAFADNEIEIAWSQFYLAMTWALSDLRDAGLFQELTGNGCPTVFATIDDSPDELWLEYRSAEFLNPPYVFKRFSRDLMKSGRSQVMVGSIVEELATPSVSHRNYVRRLESASPKSGISNR
jgi:hypothetical protein